MPNNTCNETIAAAGAINTPSKSKKTATDAQPNDKLVITALRAVKLIKNAIEAIKKGTTSLSVTFSKPTIKPKIANTKKAQGSTVPAPIIAITIAKIRPMIKAQPPKEIPLPIFFTSKRVYNLP